MEVTLHRLGGEIADLHTARAIVSAHLDADFKARAAAAARRLFWDEGLLGRIDNKGWEDTTVRLRHGLVLSLRTPYLRPSRKGWTGRPRTYRGTAGTGRFAVLEALGITDGASPALRGEVARLVVQCASYQEARDQLARDGVICDVSVIVHLAVRTGVAALRQRAAAIAGVLDGPLLGGTLLAGKRVRLGLDGGRVRTRKNQRQGRRRKNGHRGFETPWREPRLLTIEVLDEEGNPDPEVPPIYETFLGTAADIFRQIEGLLRLLGISQATVVEFLSDGADWIWRHVDGLFERLGVPSERLRLVLDYYHACEHLHAAVRACKNLSSSQQTAFYTKLSKQLLTSAGVDAVVSRLRPLVRGRRSRAIKAEIKYFTGHLGHMKYAALLSEKLSIGSGAVESGIRRIVNLRFKAASIFWREDHVEPLLLLRAILKSGRWDAFLHGFLDRQYHLLPAQLDAVEPPQCIKMAA